MITVIDYDAGNLASLTASLARLNLRHQVVADPAALVDTDVVILPGVGHFRFAKQRLLESGMWEALKQRIAQQRPLLGICLGLQLMCAASEEADGETGLGVFPVVARRLPNNVKVPHMGWSRVSAQTPSPIAVPSWLYFVHSYALEVSPQTHLQSTHGVPFSAAMHTTYAYGVQAHPERSGPEGQAYLASILEHLVGIARASS